ncbi:hypothetical protein BASA81_016571 [Batrachochytrium salamandrivorans]|nr:hypothetical protein BASA81_016571 [Batrachochytrium salamandrivorans]
MTTKPITLYGMDGSQPCRTVSWLLRIKEVDFEYVGTTPFKDTRSKEFLQLNPWGSVPVLQHGEGFTLTESAAIVTYLAEELGWTDLYPEDKQIRGRIQQWLHWHHRNSREFIMLLFGPFVVPELKFSPEQQVVNLRMLSKVAQGLDKALAKSLYLVGDSPTLADFCVFADLGQCHQTEMALFDFSPYVNLEAWFARMKTQPHYEETHVMLPMIKQMVLKAKAKSAKL